MADLCSNVQHDFSNKLFHWGRRKVMSLRSDHLQPVPTWRSPQVNHCGFMDLRDLPLCSLLPMTMSWWMCWVVESVTSCHWSQQWFISPKVDANESFQWKLNGSVHGRSEWSGKKAWCFVNEFREWNAQISGWYHSEWWHLASTHTTHLPFRSSCCFLPVSLIHWWLLKHWVQFWTKAPFTPNAVTCSLVARGLHGGTQTPWVPLGLSTTVAALHPQWRVSSC